MSALYTVTVTLKNSGAQVVFGYESKERAVNESASDRIVVFEDDFGARGWFEASEIAGVVTANVEQRSLFDNERAMAIVRRDNAFQRTLSQSPDLKFLQGGAHPLSEKK